MMAVVKMMRMVQITASVTFSPPQVVPPAPPPEPPRHGYSLRRTVPASKGSEGRNSLFGGEPEAEWTDGGSKHKAVMGKGQAGEGGGRLGRAALCARHESSLSPTGTCPVLRPAFPSECTSHPHSFLRNKLL